MNHLENGKLVFVAGCRCMVVGSQLHGFNLGRWMLRTELGGGFKPICSMYGIIWNIYLHLAKKSMVHVGKYTIHGAYGKDFLFSHLLGEDSHFD